MELLRIGVLAVRGNFREHATMLWRLGADAVRRNAFGGQAASFQTDLELLDGGPPLTDDTRLHDLFLELAREGEFVRA